MPWVGVDELAEQQARRKAAEEEYRKKMEAEAIQQEGKAWRGTPGEMGLSFLGRAIRTVGGPGFAVWNLLRGRPGAAAKNLIDTATGLVFVDPLTGVGTRLASREEQPLPTEVLDQWGVRTPEEGPTRAMVDVILGLATDPLSFIGVGAVAKGLKSVAAGVGRGGLTRTALGDMRTALATQAKGRGLMKGWAADADDRTKDLLSLFGKAGRAESDEAIEAFATKHGMDLQKAAELTPQGREYMEAWRNLEKTGHILPAGVHFDPWVARWPLRKLGLIGKDDLERRLLWKAGGFFDKAEQGIRGGAAGQVLSRLTLPGQAWGALGKYAPKAQEAIARYPLAVSRALWNPIAGVLGKQVDPAVAAKIQELENASKNAQHARTSNFRNTLTEQMRGLDRELLDDYYTQAIKKFNPDKMRKDIEDAYDEVREMFFREGLDGDVIGGVRPRPMAPAGGWARRAGEGDVPGAWAEPPTRVAPGKWATSGKVEAPADVAKSLGVKHTALMEEVITIPSRLADEAHATVKLYSAPTVYSLPPGLGKGLAPDAVHYRHPHSPHWFESVDDALEDYQGFVKHFAAEGYDPTIVRQWTPARTQFVRDIALARAEGAITPEYASFMIQTSHLFDDAVFELPVAERWMDAKRAGKRFSVAEMVEGKIRSLGGTLEGARDAAGRVLRAEPGARGSYNPVTGLLTLYNKADNLAAGAVRAAPLGMESLHVMRTRVRDFLHEMFHSGYHSMLSPEDRAFVSRLFEKHKDSLKKGPSLWAKGPSGVAAGGVSRTRYAGANPQEFFAELGARFGAEGIEKHLGIKLKKSEWSELRRVLTKVWDRMREMFNLVISTTRRAIPGRTGVESRLGFTRNYSKELAKKFPELGGAPWEQPLMEDLLSRIAPGLRKLKEGGPFEFPVKRADLGKLKPSGRTLRPQAMAAAKKLRRVEARAAKKAVEATAAAKVVAEAPIGGPPMTQEEFSSLRVGVKGISHDDVQAALNFQQVRGRLPTIAEMELIISREARRRNVDIFLLRPEAAEQLGMFPERLRQVAADIPPRVEPKPRALTPSRKKLLASQKAMRKVRELEEGGFPERYGPMAQPSARRAAEGMEELVGGADRARREVMEAVEKRDSPFQQMIADPSRELQSMGLKKYPKHFQANVITALENDVLEEWLEHTIAIQHRLPGQHLDKLMDVVIQNPNPVEEARLIGMWESALHGERALQRLGGTKKKLTAFKKLYKPKTRVTSDGSEWAVAAEVGRAVPVVSGDAATKAKLVTRQLKNEVMEAVERSIAPRAAEGMEELVGRVPRTEEALREDVKRTGHLPMGDSVGMEEFVGGQASVQAKGRKFLVYRGLRPDDDAIEAIKHEIDSLDSRTYYQKAREGWTSKQTKYFERGVLKAQRDLRDVTFTAPDPAGLYEDVVFASSNPAVAGSFAGEHGYVRAMWVQPETLTDFRLALNDEMVSKGYAKTGKYAYDPPDWDFNSFDEWAAGSLAEGEVLVAKGAHERGGEFLEALDPERLGDAIGDVWAWQRNVRVKEGTHLFTYEESVGVAKSTPRVQKPWAPLGPGRGYYPTVERAAGEGMEELVGGAGARGATMGQAQAAEREARAAFEELQGSLGQARAEARLDSRYLRLQKVLSQARAELEALSARRAAEGMEELAGRQIRQPKVPPKKAPKKEPGLLIEKRVIDEMRRRAGGDVPGAEAAVMAQFGRFLQEVQGRVNVNLKEPFGELADSVVSTHAKKGAWGTEKIGATTQKLKELQEFLHGHHQQMLGEAQSRGRMLPVGADVGSEGGQLIGHLKETDEGVHIGRINFNFYLPRQVSDAYAEAIRSAVGEGFNSGRSAAVSNAYEGFRKHGPLDEFEEAVRKRAEAAGVDLSVIKSDPRLPDLYEAVMRRHHAHNRAQTNIDFLREMAEVGGGLPGDVLGLGERGVAIQAKQQHLDDLLEMGDASPQAIGKAKRALAQAAEVTEDDLNVITRMDQVNWGKHPGLEKFMKSRMAGIGKRSEFGQQWDKINWWMKASMTTGIAGIPFMAFSMRNLIGGMIQTLMDPSAAAADAWRPLVALMHDFPLTRWFMRHTPGGLVTVDGDITSRAVSDFRKALKSPRLMRQMPGETFEMAFSKLLKAGDEGAEALARLEESGLRIAGLRPSEMVEELAESGVVGKDYAANELFKNQLEDPAAFWAAQKSLRSGSSGLEKPKGIGEYLWLSIKTNSLPRRVAASVEDTLRINSYLSMRSKGISPFRAAERTNLVHIDYKYMSAADRNMRAVIPFLRFRVGTAPVVLEQMITRPSTVTPLLKGMHSMQPGEGELVPPWLSDKMALPLGVDREGNMRFLTSFGLIHEDVNTLMSGVGDIKATVTGKGTTFGDWVRIAGLSSLHPLIKGVFQYAVGKDFFFNTELGDYRRAPAWMTEIPGMEESLQATGLLKKRTTKGGKTYYEVPRWYHPAVGMTPVNRLSNEIHKVLDQRRGWFTRVIESQTGIKLVSVDQERELKRHAANWLKDQVRAGDLGMMEVFFTRGQFPPEFTAKLKLYNALLRGETPGKIKSVAPPPGAGPAPSTPADQGQPSAAPAPRTGRHYLLGPTPVAGR